MQAGGLAAPAVLRAATARPAAWLGADGRFGTIERGRFADLIATRDDPTTDVSALRGIDVVMKEGVIVRDDAGITR